MNGPQRRAGRRVREGRSRALAIKSDGQTINAAGSAGASVSMQFPGALAAAVIESLLPAVAMRSSAWAFGATTSSSAFCRSTVALSTVRTRTGTPSKSNGVASTLLARGRDELQG